MDCALCPKTSQGALIYNQYSKGHHSPAEKCTQNCIMFILKGELLINSEEYPGTTLQSNQCILQAIGSKVELLALTDVECLVYWFTELTFLCEERYKEILEIAHAPLTYTPLTVIPKLGRLLDDLTEYFKEQPNTCGKYLDIKCQEIIYILTCYYPIQQICTFFYPISTYTESFHYFVMQNYDKVKNVEEFAHLGGYTTTTFRRLFKNMYGVPVYEWILDKKREGILDDLRYTKQRISAISSRYGFDSLSHFAHSAKTLLETLPVPYESVPPMAKTSLLSVKNTTKNRKTNKPTCLPANFVVHRLRNYFFNSLFYQGISSIFAEKYAKKSSTPA